MSETLDLLLENADVITCDLKKPRAQAVGVKAQRIYLTGSNEEMRSLREKQTRVIDCQGMTLMPGFNDAHCHIFSLVRKLFSLDLSPAAVHSIGDIQGAIRRKARFTPEGRWIQGTGYNEFYLAEKRHPVRQDLDAASGKHPVIVTHRSQHASVLNSLALKIMGITNETEEPPGGVIERDLETGEPNGVLFEMQDYLRARLKSPITEDELQWGIREADRQYLANGITSIGEATVTNDLEQWETFRKLKGGGSIKSRINMMAGSGFLEEFKEAGLITGAGDNDLKMGSLKIVLTEARGEMQPNQEGLNKLVLEASQSGFQVAIHAVERTTVEAAIKALEYVQGRLKLTDARYRIEHCSECPPELVQRLARLKAVIVSQPPFIFYHGERYLGQVSVEIQPYLYPFRSWIENDLITAGSSDSPIVPNNPLMGIYAAASRRAESGQTITANQTIQTEQALKMYTLNAAYATFEEGTKGSLSASKMADMVLLSDNPLNCPVEQIPQIRVEKTIIGGRVEWER